MRHEAHALAAHPQQRVELLLTSDARPGRGRLRYCGDARPGRRRYLSGGVGAEIGVRDLALGEVGHELRRGRRRRRRRSACAPAVKRLLPPRSSTAPAPAPGRWPRSRAPTAPRTAPRCPPRRRRRRICSARHRLPLPVYTGMWSHARRRPRHRDAARPVFGPAQTVSSPGARAKRYSAEPSPVSWNTTSTAWPTRTVSGSQSTMFVSTRGPVELDVGQHVGPARGTGPGPAGDREAVDRAPARRLEPRERRVQPQSGQNARGYQIDGRRRRSAAAAAALGGARPRTAPSPAVISGGRRRQRRSLMRPPARGRGWPLPMRVPSAPPVPWASASSAVGHLHLGVRLAAQLADGLDDLRHPAPVAGVVVAQPAAVGVERQPRRAAPAARRRRRTARPRPSRRSRGPRASAAR